MYKYEEMKKQLFAEKNQERFLNARDWVSEQLADAGAFTMGKAIAFICGDGWMAMACNDRLVELGKIREIEINDVAGQDRVFVKAFGN